MAITGICSSGIEGLCIRGRFYRMKSGKKYMKKFFKHRMKNDDNRDLYSKSDKKRMLKEYMERMREQCLNCWHGQRVMRGKNVILVIDGSYLLHSNYYATNLSVRTNKGEIRIGGVYGFIRELASLYKHFCPSNMIIVWDETGKTWRHRITKKAVKEGLIDSGYKENRKKDKDFIKDYGRQKKIVRKIIDILGIMQYGKKGIEADDLVGSFVRKIKKEKKDAIIVSSDKDYYQLLGKRVKVYSPSKGTYTEQQFCRDYGLESPKTWVLVGSLAGDAGDNIIGIRGIGEKTACKLISEHGYDNLLKKKIDGLKWSKKIRKNRELIALAEKLKRIKTKIKTPKIREFLGVDMRALGKAFKKLQFSSLNVLVYKNYFGKREEDDE